MKYRKLAWKKWNIALYESILFPWMFEISFGVTMFDDSPMLKCIVYKWGLAIWMEKE